MADIAVWPCRRQGAVLLGLVEHTPSCGDQEKPTADQRNAQHMERTEMGICPPAEQFLEQVTSVMGEPVDTWVPTLKPARQKVDGQGKAIHLGEEGDDKGAEGSERPPITSCLRLEKAIGKENEDKRVDDDQGPQAIGWRFVAHGRFSFSDLE